MICKSLKGRYLAWYRHTAYVHSQLQGGGLRRASTAALIGCRDTGDSTGWPWPPRTEELLLLDRTTQCRLFSGIPSSIIATSLTAVELSVARETGASLSQDGGRGNRCCDVIAGDKCFEYILGIYTRVGIPVLLETSSIRPYRSSSRHRKHPSRIRLAGVRWVLDLDCVRVSVGGRDGGGER